MNWGAIIADLNIALGTGASLGYLIHGDWRKSLYFFLGAAITAVVTWLL